MYKFLTDGFWFILLQTTLSSALLTQFRWTYTQWTTPDSFLASENIYFDWNWYKMVPFGYYQKIPPIKKWKRIWKAIYYMRVYKGSYVFNCLFGLVVTLQNISKSIGCTDNTVFILSVWASTHRSSIRVSRAQNKHRRLQLWKKKCKDCLIEQGSRIA